jgi:hypothetical protein
MPFLQPRRLLGLLGWFLLVPGGLTSLGALWILSSSMNLWTGTHSVTGRVVGHEQVRLQNHQRASLAQKSVVEFTAQDGRHFRVVDPVGRQLNAVHKVGESVKLRYPARKPEDAQIASSVMVQGFIGGVMLLFGAAGVLAGGLILRFRPRAAAPAAV